LRVHFARDGNRARRRLAAGLGHFVTKRHRARDRHARAAAIGKKTERRLGPHFHLPHHVGKNFDRRAGARLPAETEDRDNRDPDQQKNEKEAPEHN
jgi:hypothetical protein